MGVRASAAVVLVCSLLASDLVGLRPEADGRAGVPDASGPGGYTDVRVEVPAFRGLEPALRLSYDAGAPNGWLGVGWSLSGLSEITRTAPGRGVPSHTDQDEFHLDGLRLVRCRADGAAPVRSPGCEHPSTPAAQGYATKVEGYRRIEFEPSAAGGTWRVWNRDGTRLTYRPRLPVGTDPAAWHLAGVQDPRGNQVTYSYSQNADPLGTGREYPRAVSYNGVVVTFHSEPRPDPIDQADGRALVVTRHRLKSIDVQVRGERLRAYALRYETRTGTTSRSMLRAVQQYGRDAVLDGSGTVVSGTAAPALTLTAQAGPAPADWWAAEPVATVPDPGPRWTGARPGSVFRDQVVDREFHKRPRDPEDTPYTTGDINGDDRTDWIKVNANDDAGLARVEITTGVSDRGLVPISVSEILPWPDPDGWGDPLDRGLQVWATDVNADGSDDLILTVGHRRGRAGDLVPGGRPDGTAGDADLRGAVRARRHLSAAAVVHRDLLDRQPELGLRHALPARRRERGRSRRPDLRVLGPVRQPDLRAAPPISRHRAGPRRRHIHDRLRRRPGPRLAPRYAGPGRRRRRRRRPRRREPGVQ
nr:hypothetical protein GCM10020092_025770 [Actinoplanes digitatis]